MSKNSNFKTQLEYKFKTTSPSLEQAEQIKTQEFIKIVKYESFRLISYLQQTNIKRVGKILLESMSIPRILRQLNFCAAEQT